MLVHAALLLATLGQTSGTARTLDIQFMVAGDPQIAVWLESADGGFVDTIMVTRLVGTFGLGNRPGRADFGGGYLWPYGRREQTLPVWAHRRGKLYDRIVFQDCKEDWLGWHELVSSSEPFYCRPTSSLEVDTVTCPTTNFSTDKGIPMRLLSPEMSGDCAEVFQRYDTTSVYPPRNDVRSRDPSRDWAGVLELNGMNDVDAVSRATPSANRPFRVSYGLPATFANGEYVLWVEVNQQWDENEHHSYAYFIDPRLTDYGTANIGQPSVVWQVPLTVSGTAAVARALEYAGYGSPTGEDGDLRAPDGTITTDVPGSGEGRLLVQDDGAERYRVRVSYAPDTSCEAPAPITDLTLLGSDWGYVDVSFVASDPSTVAGYELKYAEGHGSIRTEADFVNAKPGPPIAAVDAGAAQTVRIQLPWPETGYTVAMRTTNYCGGASTPTTLDVVTEVREFATVDACFIATAAYGSKDQVDVATLRRFRDEVLMPSAVGRAFVGAYYALSPPLADAIRERPLARAVTRAALKPLVWMAEGLE
ncbi:MAG: hypothetical protein KC933_20200 [Myxococcales bacterium]|nr:hypothetical protein [Myxococcales bacterium]MCB9651136.1 hypothetical protein [Deltaproteobacteria bacterium]